MLDRSRIQFYILSMNRLSISKKAQIIALLVEGNSLRGAARLANVNVNTVMSFLVEVGMATAAYQDAAMRNLSCKRIQVDELWSFCYAKSKNLTPEQQLNPSLGSIWTWTAICPDTKLVPTWYVGGRDVASSLHP